MRKRLIIFTGLLAVVGMIAAKTTQVLAPYFKVTGKLSVSGLDYPTTDGTNGQAIITDGSGNLSFGSVGDSSFVSLTADSIYGNKIQLNGETDVELYVTDSDDAGTEARIVVDGPANGELLIGDTSQGVNDKYWMLSNSDSDFYIAEVTDAYSPPRINLFFTRNGGLTVGGYTTVDSALNVEGGIKATQGIIAAYSIDAGDSVVAADRIKAGDNTTYSYFDPGDAGLTQSSSRKIKDLKGLVSVNVSDFMSVPVYKWKYKKEYGNSNKEHYGAVAEEFKAIYGDGNTIDYEKAFWYLWAMVQEQQKEIYAIKNSSGSILNGTFRDSHSRE